MKKKKLMGGGGMVFLLYLYKEDEDLQEKIFKVPKQYPTPPQLPTISTNLRCFLFCAFPAGVLFYSSGYDSNDAYTIPRSYPIVLTYGDETKIYVSCIAFRDPVSEDIAEAYCVPANSFADKCICLVSPSPSFRLLRNTLEELFSSDVDAQPHCFLLF
ncbi:hypothetical protein L3X38_028101 [Prunus dulcis]|uniref:uDENN domain-containing protein n=1 Tax=Prunus dulcis TaxID=3755 RepID=A0AAD4Z144_PRUDU|nr:hypothetical protein L3X38_028101 [Prunus dulcis]